MSFLRVAIRRGQVRRGDPADDIQGAADDHIERLHPCHPWDSMEPEPAERESAYLAGWLW